MSLYTPARRLAGAFALRASVAAHRAPQLCALKRCLAGAQSPLLPAAFSAPTFRGAVRVRLVLCRFSSTTEKKLEWQEYLTDKGLPYYYNSQTHETSWSPPAAHYTPAPAPAHPDQVSDATKDWLQYRDERTGQAYYHNEATRETTWQLPAGCNIFPAPPYAASSSAASPVAVPQPPAEEPAEAVPHVVSAACIEQAIPPEGLVFFDHPPPRWHRVVNTLVWTQVIGLCIVLPAHLMSDSDMSMMLRLGTSAMAAWSCIGVFLTWYAFASRLAMRLTLLPDRESLKVHSYSMFGRLKEHVYPLRLVNSKQTETMVAPNALFYAFRVYRQRTYLFSKLPAHAIEPLALEHFLRGDITAGGRADDEAAAAADAESEDGETPETEDDASQLSKRPAPPKP